MSIQTVTIPQVELSLDQLIGVVRRLEPEAKSQIAQALLHDQMDARFVKFVQRLASKPPVTDISDAEINEEIRIVRGQRH